MPIASRTSRVAAAVTVASFLQKTQLLDKAAEAEEQVAELERALRLSEAELRTVREDLQQKQLEVRTPRKQPPILLRGVALRYNSWDRWCVVTGSSPFWLVLSIGLTGSTTILI